MHPGVIVCYFQKMRRYMDSTVKPLTWLINELQQATSAVNCPSWTTDVQSLVVAVDFHWNLLSMNNQQSNPLDEYRFVNVRPLFDSLQRILVTLETRKRNYDPVRFAVKPVVHSGFDQRNRLTGTVTELMTYLLQISSRFDTVVQPDSVAMMAVTVRKGESITTLFDKLPLDNLGSIFEDLRRNATADPQLLQNFWHILSHIKAFREVSAVNDTSTAQLVPFPDTLGQMAAALESQKGPQKLQHDTIHWLRAMRRETKCLVKAQVRMGQGSPFILIGYTKLIRTNVNAFRLVLSEIVSASVLPRENTPGSRSEKPTDIVDRIGQLIVALRDDRLRLEPSANRKVMGTLQSLHFLLLEARTKPTTPNTQVLRTQVFPDLTTCMHVAGSNTTVQQWVSENSSTVTELMMIVDGSAFTVEPAQWTVSLANEWVQEHDLSMVAVEASVAGPV